MVELQPAIKSLVDNQVQFVLVGGVAISFHGADYVTQDLDFCYARTKENLKRIVNALVPFKPRPRGFPENLPFIFDERTLQGGTNFTFQTSIGDIDLLGEVAGVGGYAEIEKTADTMNIYNEEVKVISLVNLIKAKRAAGRPKDLFVLPALEALKEAIDETADEEAGE
jgi:predicted nucleotidyltransferase